MTERLVAQATQ